MDRIMYRTNNVSTIRAAIRLFFKKSENYSFSFVLHVERALINATYYTFNSTKSHCSNPFKNNIDGSYMYVLFGRFVITYQNMTKLFFSQTS